MQAVCMRNEGLLRCEIMDCGYFLFVRNGVNGDWAGVMERAADAGSDRRYFDAPGAGGSMET